MVDSPFSTLFGALQITEVYHGDNDVRPTVRISDDEEVNVAVAQSPRQVVVADGFRYVTLKSTHRFAASGGLALDLLCSSFRFEWHGYRARRDQNAGASSCKRGCVQNESLLQEQTAKRSERRIQPELPEKDAEVFCTYGVLLFVPDTDTGVRP